jgi:hypothetical protein
MDSISIKAHGNGGDGNGSSPGKPGRKPYKRSQNEEGSGHTNSVDAKSSKIRSPTKVGSKGTKPSHGDGNPKQSDEANAGRRGRKKLGTSEAQQRKTGPVIKIDMQGRKWCALGRDSEWKAGGDWLVGRVIRVYWSPDEV